MNAHKQNFLSAIAANKQKEVRYKKQNSDPDSMIQSAVSAKPARSFLQAVLESEPPCIIAEIKRRSPSRGELLKDPDIKGIAEGFASGGATALSVLTDEQYFGGSLADLETAKKVVNIPVLRKDFIVDEFQIYESRASGADTVLLIVKILDDRLEGFIGLSRKLGMEPLVEIHNEAELKTAVDAGSQIIGINSRNLETFITNTDIVERIMRDMPKHTITIAESGIASTDTISDLLKLGVNGFLIGEAFMRADSPANKLKEFVNKFRLSPFIERR